MTPEVECYACERTIPVGEPAMSITYSIERVDLPGEITVESSAALVTTCIDCSRSLAEVVAALGAAGFPVSGGVSP